MRMAQHMNMVYCNREREGVNSCPGPCHTSTPAGKGEKGIILSGWWAQGVIPMWGWTSSLPGARKPLALVVCHRFPWMEFFITHPLLQRCQSLQLTLAKSSVPLLIQKKEKKRRWKFIATLPPLLGLDPALNWISKFHCIGIECNFTHLSAFINTSQRTFSQCPVTAESREGKICLGDKRLLQSLAAHTWWHDQLGQFERTRSHFLFKTLLPLHNFTG